MPDACEASRSLWTSRLVANHRRALLRDQSQKGFLRIGKLLDPFGHESRLLMLDVDLGIDFGEHFLRRHLVDLALKSAPAGFDRVVGGRRVGLDVAAGKSLDIFP